MSDRITFLKSLSCDAIDDMSEVSLPVHSALRAHVNNIQNDLLSRLPVSYDQKIADFLVAHEDTSDAELVVNLTRNYSVVPFDSKKYASKDLLISKVNHGFWEHLAYLNARPEHRTTYRDVNLPLRERQYLTGNFLPLMLASMLEAVVKPSISRFISCTTGIENFARTLGEPWGTHNVPLTPYVLSDFKRGAVRGLLAFAHLYESTQPAPTPITVHDSYNNNLLFENGTLFEELKAAATQDTVCLIIGPKHLNQIRVLNWPGPHAFLAVSNSNAHAQWKINIENLFSVLHIYNLQKKDVTILFQGGASGPVIVYFLEEFRKNLDIKVSFLDLGRLLDVAFESDLTKTGSPLPSRTFKLDGTFSIVETPDQIYYDGY